MTATIRLLIVVNVLALVAFAYALRVAPPLEARAPAAEQAMLSGLLAAGD